ncbi:hypothetical protein [Paraburkholderia sp. J63]|uniref:hypothetical protein n=1 Tax=Paraburkholderia sp. J63 TaxID=2805434 RepID=UPI002ABEA089|nr:hypothetical protein [Paraburkholderia sp. J63]
MLVAVEETATATGKAGETRAAGRTSASPGPIRLVVPSSPRCAAGARPHADVRADRRGRRTRAERHPDTEWSGSGQR